MRIKSYYLILIFVLGVLGCGDRSLEDYERSRVSEELAAFQKIEGVYEGELLSGLEGKSLGDMKISFEPNTSVVSETSYAVRQQLALAGQLQIENEEFFSSSFSEGFYNPQSGEIDIQFEITRRDDSAVKMKVRGFIEKDVFKGRLNAESFTERAALFSLARVNQDPSQFPSRSSQISTDLKQAFDEWTAIHERGEVKLRVIRNEETQAERFVNLFIPIRLLDVIVDFYATAQVPFLMAEFDERTGILKGVYGSRSETNPSQISLECRTGPALLNTKLMNCRYINMINSLVLDLELKR